MTKILVLVLTLLFLINPADVSAERTMNQPCGASYSTDPNEPCEKDYDCLLDPTVPKVYYCQYSPVSATFGKIQAPGPLAGLLKGDPTGAGGISKFLSNFVKLIYSISIVVMIFMLLWGAFDWIISEGDKEKLANAQKKLINAFIGIILLAAAFAVLNVLGTFTGFKFFV